MCLTNKLTVELQSKFKISWDPIHHRIRCQGHVLNLTAHAFLYATKDEALEGDDNPRITQTPDQMKTWREEGPLGKLHNINTWIFGSPQRLEVFELIAGRRIPRDNATRWNSWQMQIEVALKLRAEIDRYIRTYGKEDPEARIHEDILTDEDWNILSKINDTLAILKQTTKSLENSFTSLSMVMPAMELIMGHFECQRTSADSTMAPLYQAGWEKMMKYYRGTDDSPVYAAAQVLHPLYKWEHIEESWEKSWVTKAKVYIALIGALS